MPPEPLPDVLAIAADIPSMSISQLVTAPRPDYYVDEHALREAVRSGGSFNAVHMVAGVKVDFFVAGSDPFERARLRSRIAIPVRADPPLSLWFDTAEHTLLRKLEWYRRGGEVSDRQWRDVLAIVALQGERLDREAMAKWAATLGVSDLLQRSLGNGI